jgi:hypothetical protein
MTVKLWPNNSNNNNRLSSSMTADGAIGRWGWLSNKMMGGSLYSRLQIIVWRCPRDLSRQLSGARQLHFLSTKLHSVRIGTYVYHMYRVVCPSCYYYVLALHAECFTQPRSVKVEFSVHYEAMLCGYCIIASVLLFFVCGAYGKGKSSLQYA